MSRKARVACGAVAITAALATSSVLVLQASNAAFSATTKNPNNTWTTGAAPVLTDDDNTDTAMFTANGLTPGDTGVKCIVVTATPATASADLRFYSVRADASTLASQLNMTVERGSGGSFNSCTGFVPSATLVNNAPLSALPGDYGTASSTSVPISTGTTATVYRITYSLPANMSSTYASMSTKTQFTWEIR